MKIFVIFFSLFFNFSLLASSCCGSAGGGNNIILSDNKDEFFYSISRRNDLGHSNDNKEIILNSEKVKDEQHSHYFSYSRQVTELIQASMASQIVVKKISKGQRSNENSGFSGLDFQSSYELLPEYSYSLYRPRLFAFFKYSIPLSKSIYNSQDDLQTDVFGEGFHSVTFGILTQKKWDTISFKIGSDYKYLFSKNFNGLVVKDFYKISIPFALSFNRSESDFVYGATNSFNYTSPKITEGLSKSKSSPEYFWLSSVFVNYNYSREVSFGINYSDSSLVGPSKNSPLYNSISFSFIRAQEI